MSAIVAQSHHIFGIRAGVTNNVFYFDEQTIIFPCGNNCLRYNIDQKWQKFIQGSDKSHGMLALAISPNRRYLAVSERGEKGSITVYDLQQEQSKKRKVLTGGELPVQEFLCMAFSPDSKYLIAQAGAPDWTLFYWVWEKQKVMATMKTSSQSNPISQVSFNPQDNTQICVTGNGVFKLFRYAEGSLKQSSFQKLEGQNILCHAWVSEERVIAGTETAKLLVFESGDLRWEMTVEPKPASQEAERLCSSTEHHARSISHARVSAIVAYSKGFACSAGPGAVCLFEKTEEKDVYRKAREIRIPQDLHSHEPSHAEQQQFAALCISPSEETLVGSTDRGQLYSITLSSVEMSRGEQAKFEFLSYSFHYGIITGLDICIRKPLIATCSLDRSVRIWNYETRFVNIWWNPEIPKGLLACLKGVLCPQVRSIVWSPDDSRLVSCGMDGAVYEWNTITSKRESESVLKACSYTGITISPDAKTFFAVGSDCTLKEITDSQILREVHSDDVPYTTIVMSHSGRMIFTGTAMGTIRAMKYPLPIQKEWNEYQGHASPITKFLLTVCEHGCLYIWRIIDKEGRGLKREKEVVYAEEILITKSDLEEKNQVMTELKTRVEELKMENEYQLRLKDMNYNEKIKELTEKFIQEMESLKTKNQVLKTEKDKQELNHEKEIADVVERHSKEQQDLGTAAVHLEQLRPSC
ncbi:UNVERIFIED_CONTAM: hypothetical protein FKN15_005121 [Acipenser sinensis]